MKEPSGNKIQSTIERIDRSNIPRPFLDKKYAVAETQIRQSEEEIGFPLPESYVYFLSEFGSGDFGGIEFYGLLPQGNHIKEIPNALWLTLKSRELEGLPSSYFVVENLDDGAIACLDLSVMTDKECPVVLWELGESGNSKPHVLADTFGDYFEQRITLVLEN